MRRITSVLALSLFTVVPSVFGQVGISVDAPSTVQLGMDLRYIIQVTNSGGSSVSGIVVTDNLPAGVSATSFSSNCAGTTQVICDIGTLAGGQSATTEIEVVPTATGELSNLASVAPGGASVTVSTNVINNGVPLVVSPFSSDPTDVVTSNPAGINCAASLDFKHRCFAFFPPGSMVTLTASSTDFVGWSVKGSPLACSGTGTCTLTMSQEQLVTAGFTSPIAFLLPSFGATGVVNFPFAVDLTRAVIPSLGSTAPYIYSIASGTLPPGLTLSGSLISGTPTTVGATSVTVQYQDSSSPTPQTATANLTFTIINAPNTQPSLLKGQYAVLFRGVSDGDASERALVGSLAFDGLGGVTGFIDSNCNGPSPCTGLQQQVAVSGTYSIGPDNRGLVSLNNGMIFAIAVGNVSTGIASSARIVRFDDITGTGTRGAGEFRKQDTTAFSQTSLAGPYVYGLTGESAVFNRLVESGLLTFDSSGGVGGGPADLNKTIVVLNFSSITGTYTAVDPAIGRTTLSLTYTFSGGGISAFPVVAYIVDANNLFMMSTFTGTPIPLEAGTAERQTVPAGGFTNSSLAGPDVVTLQGPSGAMNSSNSFTLLGLATFAGSTASITYDSDNDRIIQIQASESDLYSVASNGRVTVGLSGTPLIAYLAGQDHGYVIATNITGSPTDDNPDPGFGEINLQQAGPFSNATFSGSYILGDHEPASPSGGPVTSGVMAANACSANYAIDQGHESGRLDYDMGGAFGFSVSSSGRVSTTFNELEALGTGNLVGYMASPSRLFLSDVDPGSHHPHIVEVTPASSTPAPTLQAITVSPSTATIATGQTQQYTATGTYSDGSHQDLTSQVNWISSNLNAATISPTGLATAMMAGSASILAGLGCLSSNPATNPVTLTVSAGTTLTATTTTLTSSANPAILHQNVTLTATVATSPAGGTPTGTVKFSDGLTLLATVPLTGGVATYSTSSFTIGSHPLTAAYSGDSSDNPSSGTLTQLVQYQQLGTCDGGAGHQILPPIDPAGTSVFNFGRTVPAKFRVCDANGSSVGTAGVVTSFFLTGIFTGTTNTSVEDVVDTNVPDAAFRWDSTDQQWIFNISTQNLSAGSTYVYTITLNDGTMINFQYGLR